MTRLRPAALLLLAALPGAAWAACNPTGSILCCTPHEELECDEIEWPRADGVEGFQTDDGIVHFHLTGLPEGLTWTGTIVKTWEPVDDETECTTDPIRTPTSGSIQSIITWNIYQNGTVIASGTDIDAETAEPVSGLVRCVFSVASFADACGYDSQSYELEQNFTQAQTPVIVLDVSGGIVPRYSTDPAGRPTLTCTVRALEGTTFPLTVHLSGRRIRFEEGSLMSRTIILTDTSPVTFAISGQEWSDMMDDGKIYARASSELGEVEAAADVTVVWVEPISMRDSGEPTSPPENKFTYDYQPKTLGLTNVLSNPLEEPPFMQSAYAVEFKGRVHPSDFDKQLFFTRDSIDETIWWINANGIRRWAKGQPKLNQNRGDGSGAGNDDPRLDSQSPEVSETGYIYDVDLPGLKHNSLISIANDNKPCTIRIHYALNFLQYVFYEGNRVSNDFHWFVRMTHDCSMSATGEFSLAFPTDANANVIGEGQLDTTDW